MRPSQRLLARIITHTLYRFRCRHLKWIPKNGPAVLVCNHVSYMDAILIVCACRRSVRFVINSGIYQIPPLNRIFRAVRAIPVAVEKNNPKSLKKAFDEMAAALDAGEMICLFPEGHLTPDGAVGRFRPGIERIIARNPVPVVPMALKGLWGSFFSNGNGPAMRRFPRRFGSYVELVAGPPVMPSQVAADPLRTKVISLKGEKN